MRASSVALFFAGFAVQQVSATWNRRAGHFNTPEYNNNECSVKQKEGYNWQEVPRGSFSDYDDFNFKDGWTCADRFGKRDSITKRSFNSKCVKNKVAKKQPASFDCSKRKDGFSIKEIQVSVEFDCDLEFHFKMPDGLTCKQITACKKEGTVVRNTQCGGAIEVDVYLGNHNQESREDCEIGFHQIDFDCTPPYIPSPLPGSSLRPVPSSKAVPVTFSTPPVSSSSASPAQPPISSPPVDTPSLPPVTSSSPPTVKFPSLPPYTNGTSLPTATPVSTPPAVPESSTTLPQTEGSTTPKAETTSTTPEAKTSSTEAPVPSSSSSSIVPSPPTSFPPPPGPPSGYTPPECLPKCMNTWLTINTQCADNTDANCYCKNPDFTKSVIECVAAWATDSETQQALQYLIGICASHIPENPGIITNCPTYIPLNPTPPATNTEIKTGIQTITTTAAPGVTAPPTALPVTTITYDTTVKVPCSCAASTETLTTMTSTITVPQVIFTTQTPAQPPAPGVTPSEAPVVLVPGTPPPVPAQTTAPPYPISSISITVPTGFGTVTRPGANATTTEPAQFLGAGPRVGAGYGTAFVGVGVVALLVL